MYYERKGIKRVFVLHTAALLETALSFCIYCANPGHKLLPSRNPESLRKGETPFPVSKASTQLPLKIMVNLPPPFPVHPAFPTSRASPFPGLV